MTKDEFIAIAIGADFEPRPYSGRGMYGKSCMSITADNIHDGLASLIYTLDDREEIDFLVRHFRWDSLGDGVVIYWLDIPA